MHDLNSNVIDKNDLSLSSLKDLVFNGDISLEDAVHQFEKNVISEALHKNHNNLTHTAKMLGISRRMVKYKVDHLINHQTF